MRWTALSCVLGFGLGCNTADQYALNSANADGSTPFHRGLGGISSDDVGSAGRLTLLPQDAGDASPACLDGSQYGFYFVPSTTNSTKWTISIEGGGWCYDEDACFSRSKMSLGSSKSWAKTAGCGCMNVEGDGLDHDCNCLYMPYGDGASFSGYRAKPWPVPGTSNETLTFRGIKNFDATIEWALAHGLDQASEFVLTGGSAGGLSTFLHMDRAGAAIKKVNPAVAVRGAPVVGYFLDHPNYLHTDGGLPNTPTWERTANYTAKMKHIYGMQNLTFGADGGLTAACQQAFPDRPHYCFMSPHMQAFVDTPFYIFNSKFDAWQMGEILQIGCLCKQNASAPSTSCHWAKANCDSAKAAAIVQYGADFLHDLQPVVQESHNGAFITSCICHGCAWADLSVAKKTAYSYYRCRVQYPPTPFSPTLTSPSP
jgi:hypothetical protein